MAFLTAASVHIQKSRRTLRVLTAPDRTETLARQCDVYKAGIKVLQPVADWHTRTPGRVTASYRVPL